MALVLKNAGDIQTTGMELAINLTPIQTNDFSWDMNLTVAQSKTEIVSLAKDQDKLRLSRAYWGRAYLYATVGKEWGNIIGKKFKRNHRRQSHCR